MFIITSEEAEKHIKPPELARIIVTPLQTQLKPGTKQTFTVRGLDQFGCDTETETVEWTATGGEIAQDGVFKAAEDEGNFVVSAKAGKVSVLEMSGLARNLNLVAQNPQRHRKSRKD